MLPCQLLLLGVSYFGFGVLTNADAECLAFYFFLRLTVFFFSQAQVFDFSEANDFVKIFSFDSKIWQQLTP